MKRKYTSEAAAQDHTGFETVMLSIFNSFLGRKLSCCFGSEVSLRFTITRINLIRGFNNTVLNEPEFSGLGLSYC